MLVYPGSSLDLSHHTTEEMKEFFITKNEPLVNRGTYFLQI